MRFGSRLLAVGFAAVVALSAPEARAIDKDAKKWMEGVQALMLPDEEKTLKDLKDKGDIAEFQKIFWKRRDPDLETAENEHQKEYEKARAEADLKFKVAGRIGSRTDCGRMFILYGAAADVKVIGEETPGRRAPERWIYFDPTTKQPTGQADFDEECMLPAGSRLAAQMVKAAESRISFPSLDYRKGKDGKIVKLEDQLPKPSPVQTLLKQPRQDFEVTAEPILMIRGQGGAAYVAGTVSVPFEGLEVQEVLGKKTGRLEVATAALDSTGKAVATEREREASVEVGADGRGIVSFRSNLRAGDYTLRVAVHDKKTSKGSVAEIPIKVPDLGSELVVSAMLSKGVVVTSGESPDVSDPLTDFVLFGGGQQIKFLPAPGAVFTVTDKLEMLAWIYGAQPSPAPGAPGEDPKPVSGGTAQTVTTETKMAPPSDSSPKTKVVVSTALMKDGRTKAKADDITYDRADFVMHQVGPLDLSSFGPGKYTVQFKIKDQVAGKELTKEMSFEVK